MIAELCARLAAVDGLCGRPCSGAVVGIDRDPAAKVTVLLFDERGRLTAVAKATRDERADTSLRSEHASLRELAESSATTLRHQVPRPLLLERVRGHLVLVTSAVPGSPMTVGYYTPGHVEDAGLVRRDFELVGGWLRRLQEATCRGTLELGADAYDDRVAPLVARYRDRVGWSDWEADLFGELEARFRALAPMRLPLVRRHGDFAIGNVLVHDDAVSGVVDWELSRSSDLPLTDVFKFAASYSSFLDRAAPPRAGLIRGHPGWSEAARRWPPPPGWSNLAGFMYGFFGDGWYPDLVRRFVDQHAARVGASDDAVAVLLRLFVAEQALVLDNPFYREGYRSLLRALHDQLHIPVAHREGVR